jgi:hypothetical protein
VQFRWAVLSVVTVIALGALAMVGWFLADRDGPAAVSDSTKGFELSPTSSSSRPPPPALTETGAANSVDAAMLTPTDLSKLLGGVKVTDDIAGGNEPMLVLKSSVYGPGDHSRQVDPTACSGLIFTGELATYAGFPVQAMRTDTYTYEMSRGSDAPRVPTQVQLTTAAFPSSIDAAHFMRGKWAHWKACASPEAPPIPQVPDIDIGVTLGYENSRGFVLGPVQDVGGAIAVSMAHNGALHGPDACQIALGMRDNIIVEARTCEVQNVGADVSYDAAANPSLWAVPDAERLVAAMAAK